MERRSVIFNYRSNGRAKEGHEVLTTNYNSLMFSKFRRLTALAEISQK